MRFTDFIPPSLIKSMNSQELKITLINGSIIQIIGSDSYDSSLIGTNPRMVVFSEFALADPDAFKFVRPILNANGGSMIIVSTPRGKNELWNIFNIAQHSTEWFCEKLSLADTGHIPLEVIQQDIDEGLVSKDLVEQEYYCFPVDTEVLGSDRLIKIQDIKIDDLVFSHTGRIRKVTDLISRHYEGEMIEISSFGSYEKIVCTPNHPIRIYNKGNQTYEWKPAGLISSEDRLVFPKINIGNSFKVTSHELVLLIAWYICDGSTFKNGLQITVNKTVKLPIVESVLNKLNIDYSVINSTYYDSVCNVVVYDTKIVDFLRMNFGTFCYNKHINFSLISGFEDEFFHELIKGDGCFSSFDGYNKYCFSTTSKTLAYQVQMLSNSLNRNYAAGITKKDAVSSFINDRAINCRDSYVVNIGFQNDASLGTNKNKLVRTKYSIAANIKSIRRFDFNGQVYNIKVQYDESYIVGGRSVHNCSFDRGAEGSYYSKYIDKLRINGQIGQVPWEPQFLVSTAWDIGVRDSTCIIFFQVIGKVVHIIDSYEKSKEGLEHYVNVIKNKPYQYDKHWAPHDIAVKEFGSGLTRLEKARQLGLKFETRDAGTKSGLPMLSIEDGIEAVRSALPKMWFDAERCKGLIKSLENYRQEFDDKRKVYRSQPLHDASSHFADSMRYLVLSLSRSRDGHSTPEELEKRYRQAQGYGGDGLGIANGFFQDNHRMY